MNKSRNESAEFAEKCRQAIRCLRLTAARDHGFAYALRVAPEMFLNAVASGQVEAAQLFYDDVANQIEQQTAVIETALDEGEPAMECFKRLCELNERGAVTRARREPEFVFTT